MSNFGSLRVCADILRRLVLASLVAGAAVSYAQARFGHFTSADCNLRLQGEPSEVAAAITDLTVREHFSADARSIGLWSGHDHGAGPSLEYIVDPRLNRELLNLRTHDDASATELLMAQMHKLCATCMEGHTDLSHVVLKVFELAKFYHANLSVQNDLDLDNIPFLRLSLEFSPPQTAREVVRAADFKRGQGDVPVPRVDIDIRPAKISLIYAKSMGHFVGDILFVEDQTSHGLGVFANSAPARSGQRPVLDADFIKAKYLLGESASPDAWRLLEIARAVVLADSPGAHEVELKARGMMFISTEANPTSWLPR